MFSGSIQSADYESERKLKRKRIYLFPHTLDVSIFRFLSFSSDLWQYLVCRFQICSQNSMETVILLKSIYLILLHFTSGEYDEIRTYVKSRYLSSTEACFRLLKLKMHGKSHPVFRLQLHMPVEQSLYSGGMRTLQLLRIKQIQNSWAGAQALHKLQLLIQSLQNFMVCRSLS